MVTDKAKVAALGKNRGFLLSRTVIEAEYELTGDAIAMRDLHEVTFRDAGPVQRAQHEKAMDQPFLVTHLHWRRPHRDAAEQTN
jgi:hypothetical protein